VGNKVLSTLKKEHVVAKSIVTVLFRIVEDLRTGKSVSLLYLKELIEAISRVMEMHHRKEMEVFAYLTPHEEIAKEDLLDVLTEEHNLGYEYFANAVRIIDHADKANNEKHELIPFHVDEYAKLLKEHIRKEENGFFPMIKKFITEEEQDKILKAFGKIEQELQSRKEMAVIESAIQKFR
jgi:hemerythrin-like domain-containing protein